MEKSKALNHLYLRAAFGASPDYVIQRISKPFKLNVDELFHNSSNIIPFTPLKNPVADKPASNIKLLFTILKSRKQIMDMGDAWIEHATHYPYPSLREKMVYFWHSYFATRIPLAYLMQVQNNTIRQHALGSFRELLHAMAKDPAIIVFLNNQQNRKKHPNENFAREVMELFSLGEGNYTEHDIREAARAFTGWHINRYGEYEFNNTEHDFGEKSFKGKKGRFSGEDIIDIILDDKQCAHFITQKVYSFFVNTTIKPHRVEKLAKDFYQSNYDIEQLMKNIFSSEWFFDEENTGTKIASPIELILRYHTILGINNTPKRTFTRVLQNLGQEMFYPPNVAGWPGGRNWIDSSSMLLRMKLPFLFFSGYEHQFSRMEDTDAAAKQGFGNKININSYANWVTFANNFNENETKNLINLMADIILQRGFDFDDEVLLDLYSKGKTKVEKIKSIAVHLFALPEFQLI